MRNTKIKHPWGEKSVWVLRREEGLSPGRHERQFSFPYKVKNSNSKAEAR